MKVIAIKGWFGSYICKWCGGVAPYGICHICNK
jgi:hypothetical protein